MTDDFCEYCGADDIHARRDRPELRPRKLSPNHGFKFMHDASQMRFKIVKQGKRKTRLVRVADGDPTAECGRTTVFLKDTFKLKPKRRKKK